MSSKTSHVTVRPVEEGEITRVIEFLRNGFVPNLTAEALRGLFEYRWSGAADRPNRGFALWSENRIVGFLGAFYADRPLAGRMVKTCNLSTWYVEPELRQASMKLLYAVMAQKDYNILNLTPSPGVRRVMESLKFQPIDMNKLVYLPWHFPLRMLSPGLKLLTKPEKIAELLEGEELQFLRDHLRYRLKHYLLSDGNDYSYLILKRRFFPGVAAFSRVPIKKARQMWYPCMEVLHLSNPELALRKWGGLVSAIIRRECVLALVLAERFLGAGAPPSGRFDHRNYLLARSPLNTTLDSLYSELAVLPI